MQNFKQMELKFALPRNVSIMLENPYQIDEIKQNQITHRENEKIKKVAILVVSKIEMDPLLKKFNPELNEELTSQMIGLGRVFTQRLDNIELFFIKSLTSQDFDCENTGYSIVAALSALIVSIIDPDLLINFSICAAMNATKCNIGDFILTKNCFHMDRLRTKDQNAFEWGLWGGISINTSQIQKQFNLKCEDFSRISMNSFQERILEKLQINYVDMECACIAEILNQTNTNFIGIKTVGFKINNQNISEQELQFQNFISRWYHQDVNILFDILAFIDGKQNSQL